MFSVGRLIIIVGHSRAYIMNQRWSAAAAILVHSFFPHSIIFDFLRTMSSGEQQLLDGEELMEITDAHQNEVTALRNYATLSIQHEKLKTDHDLLLENKEQLIVKIENLEADNDALREQIRLYELNLLDDPPQQQHFKPPAIDWKKVYVFSLYYKVWKNLALYSNIEKLSKSVIKL